MSALERLGIPASIVLSELPVKLTRNSRVTVACSCGSEATLQVASIIRTIKRVGFYRCLSCGIKAKHQDPAFQKSHSDGILRSWTGDRKENQSHISKELWSNPEFRDRAIAASTSAWIDPEKRKTASQKAKGLWQDPEFQAKQSKINESKSATSAILAKSLWEDSEYRQKQLDSKSDPDHILLQSRLAIQRWQDPEYRSIVSQSLTEYYSDPQLRKSVAERAFQLWKDPKYVEKQIVANLDPTFLKLKSENAKKQWSDPTIRQKIMNGVKGVWSQPEYRKLASDNAKKQWLNSQYREKQAIGRSSILLNGKDSILERVTQTILGALGIPYIRHRIIGYWEFDLFIPSHNLLVECNGEYWHSLRKSQDSSKFTYIDEYFPQYKVLYLWERDFLNPGLIQQKLSRALAIENDSPVICDFSFADVSIRKMDTSAKLPNSFYSAPEEFLQSYHYAGYGRSARAVYGTFIGDKLVGVCKFAPPVRAEAATSMGLTQSQVLELDRFCIHPLYHKKNFASWMLSRCQNMAFSDFPSVSALISFADSTFGHHGTIYKAANWSKLHDVKPDYHYLSPDGFVVHKKTLYDHACRNSRSESEYAELFGYVKVFGKAKTKFCLRRSG